MPIYVNSRVPRMPISEQRRVLVGGGLALKRVVSLRSVEKVLTNIEKHVIILHIERQIEDIEWQTFKAGRTYETVWRTLRSQHLYP